MSAHSILPPSGAKAWAQCPAWVEANRRYPQDDSEASREGTAAHEVAWWIVDGKPVSEGMPTTNGVVVTGEMIDGAELLAQTVRDRMPREHYGARPHIEERTAISSVHPECFGTPDVWAYAPKLGVLEVIDYKFGHRFVDEFENEQGVAYISGIIDRLAELTGVGAGYLDQHLTVNFTIVQPRCYYRGSPVRTWTIKASDIRPLVNRLTMAAGRALRVNPEAVTNSECSDCPGRHACPALQQAAYRDAETAVQAGFTELPPDAASLELRMLERALDRLQARVEGLREAVTAYGRQGVPTPYHALEQGYGRQQWTIPVDQVLALGQLMGVDLSKPGVKTPKQAQSSGVDEAVIKAYSSTPLGQLKLTPVNPADARRVFG